MASKTALVWMEHFRGDMQKPSSLSPCLQVACPPLRHLAAPDLVPWGRPVDRNGGFRHRPWHNGAQGFNIDSRKDAVRSAKETRQRDAGIRKYYSGYIHLVFASRCSLAGMATISEWCVRAGSAVRKNIGGYPIPLPVTRQLAEAGNRRIVTKLLP
jgi:hypothetical protein